MDALDALSVEQLASLLKTKIESTLHNGQYVSPIMFAECALTVET